MAGKKVAVSCILAGALFVVAILLLQGFFLGEGGPAVSPPPSEEPVSKALSKDTGSVLPEGSQEPGDSDSVAGDEPSDEGTAGVVPEGPLSLEGRVTDEAGEGIEGARVLALDLRTWREIFSEMESRFQGSPLDGIKHLKKSFEEAGHTVPSAKTDPEGRYGFQNLLPGERRILVSHPEYLARSNSWVILQEGETARCDVSLVEGFRITGRIVDEQGAGVAGAAVRVTSSESRDIQGIGQMIQLIVSLAEADVLLTPGDAVTAKDGSFSVGSLAPIPHDVEVAKQGYVPELSRKIPAGTSDFVLAVRKGLTLRGRILTPGGDPAPGADVQLAMPQGPLNFDNPMIFQDFGDVLTDRTLKARTADDGSFELVGAEEGPLELRVQARGFPDLQQPLEVRKSSEDLGEIRLLEPATIAGRVVDPSGVGVAGALVSVSKPEPQRRPGMRAVKVAECDTDQDGYFVLEGLEAGAFNAKAVHDERGEATLPAVETGRRDVVLKLEPGFQVRGSVLDDETDAPVPEVKVQTLDGSRSTMTDAKGEFLLRGITEESTQRFGGNVLLRARHRDYDAGSASMKFGEEKQVEIRLQVATGIEGRVVDGEGNPVEGARIWMEVPGVPMSLFLMDPQSATESAYSNTEGSFFLRPPQGGRRMTLDIVAVRTGTGRVRAGLPEKNAEGAWPLVELVLEPGLTLEGRVVDPDGAPVPRARVTLSRVVEEVNPEFQMIATMLPPGRDSTTYSGKDGNYALEELHPGTYKLLVEARGYAKQIIEGVQVLADEASQDVVLQAGGTISGRVVNFDGEPLPGVEVLAFVETEPPEGNQDGGMYEVTRAFQNTSGSGIARTRTDEGGNFSLTHLPDGVFRAVARATGFEVGEVRNIAPGDPVNDIVLVPFARVAGRVVEATRGALVADFRVELRPVKDPTAGAVGFYDSRLNKTFQESNGEYLMENVPPGRYEVWVSSEGYAPFNKAAEVAPGGQVVVDAILQVGVEVTGVVRSAEDGQPLEGINVYVNKVSDQEGAGRPLHIRKNTRTADDGSFSVEGLGDGEYHAGFSSKEWYVVDGKASVRFRIPSEKPLHFEVKLLPAGQVAGNIAGLHFDDRTTYYRINLIREEGSDAAGDTPPPGSRNFSTGIFAQNMNSSGGRPPGSFSLGGLPPGTYRVEVSSPQSIGSPGDPVQPVPPQVLGTVEVRAAETTRFDGAVSR